MQEPVTVVCPASGERLTPAKVWVSHLPNGQEVIYGQLKVHHHHGEECEWSHMVQPVEQQ